MSSAGSPPRSPTRCGCSDANGRSASTPARTRRRPFWSRWASPTPRWSRWRASTRRWFPRRRCWRAPTEDWWTIGRRVRVGRAIGGGLTADAARVLRVRGTPGSVRRDARERGRRPRGVAGRAGRRSTSPPSRDSLLRPDFWRTDTLTYEASVPVGGTDLTVSGHDGGEVDWFTADATGPLAAPAFCDPSGAAAAAGVPGRARATVVADRGRRRRHRRLPAGSLAPCHRAAHRAHL